MPYFAVDDRFGTHRKVLAIPRAIRLATVGLWTLAGSWSAGHLTDGQIPAYMLEELGGDPQMAAALVAAGLWRATEDGWEFYDWAGNGNFTRAQVDEKRAGNARRQAEWRERRNASRDAESPVTNGKVTRYVTGEVTGGNCAPSHPIPSLPIPTPSLRSGEPEGDSAGEAPPWAEFESTAPAKPADAITAEFEDFWRAYPRKVGKGQALKAYRTARRKVEAEVIAAALHTYRAVIQDRSPEMIRHPSTWLNGEPWEDDPDAIAPTPTPELPRHQRERDAQLAEWERLYGTIENPISQGELTA